MNRFYQRARVSLVERAEGDDKPADSIGTLSGYIAVFNSDSYDLGGFVEQVAPGAFAETLEKNRDLIVCLVNHDHSRPVGRLSKGTLRLVEDATGLRFEVDLPDTSFGRDVLVSARRGDVEGCSFGFDILEDKWSQREGADFCVLLKVDLWEVSVGVTFPAYGDTSMQVRERRSKARLSRWRDRARMRLECRRRSAS